MASECSEMFQPAMVAHTIHDDEKDARVGCFHKRSHDRGKHILDHQEPRDIGPRHGVRSEQLAKAAVFFFPP